MSSSSSTPPPMDINVLKAQIIEEVHKSLDGYIEKRVDELLQAFFAPLFASKPPSSNEKKSTEVSEVEKDEGKDNVKVEEEVVEVKAAPVEVSEPVVEEKRDEEEKKDEEEKEESPVSSLVLSIAANPSSLNEYEYADDSLSTTTSASVSLQNLVDKPTQPNLRELTANMKKFYVAIYNPVEYGKNVHICFNDVSQGLLRIIHQHYRQFRRVIPQLSYVYRELVNNQNKFLNRVEPEIHQKLQERNLSDLQNLLFDYIDTNLKVQNYVGFEERNGDVRYMWKIDYPGDEERLIIVQLSKDPLCVLTKTSCHIITAFIIKRSQVNPIKPVTVHLHPPKSPTLKIHPPKPLKTLSMAKASNNIVLANRSLTKSPVIPINNGSVRSRPPSARFSRNSPISFA